MLGYELMQAVYADGHPCPQAPFGTAIVNTTSDELVCVISNAVGTTGGGLNAY